MFSFLGDQKVIFENLKYICIFLPLSTFFASEADLVQSRHFWLNNGSASSLHLAAFPGPVAFLCEPRNPAHGRTAAVRFVSPASFRPG
jgi:hypothetical protein